MMIIRVLPIHVPRRCEPLITPHLSHNTMLADASVGSEDLSSANSERCKSVTASFPRDAAVHPLVANDYWLNWPSVKHDMQKGFVKHSEVNWAK